MVLGILFLILILADQASKAVAFALLDSLDKNVTVIPGFLGFDTIRNDGAAYGLFKNWDFAPYFLIIVTCIALIVMLIAVVKLQKHKRFLRSSLVIIMAGAVGNLIDRIVEFSVRDFIDVSVGNIGFLNFNCNVADIAVTVGAVMLVLALLFIDRDSLVRSLLHSKKEKEEVAAAAAELEQAAPQTDNDLGVPPQDAEPAESAVSKADGSGKDGG